MHNSNYIPAIKTSSNSQNSDLLNNLNIYSSNINNDQPIKKELDKNQDTLPSYSNIILKNEQAIPPIESIDVSSFLSTTLNKTIIKEQSFPMDTYPKKTIVFDYNIIENDHKEEEKIKIQELQSNSLEQIKERYDQNTPIKNLKYVNPQKVFFFVEFIR